jgi:hypothetical protein
MQNKVYFTEVKPGVYKRDSKFKLKSDFVAHTQFKEIDAFGWRIHEKKLMLFLEKKQLNYLRQNTSKMLSKTPKYVP